MKPETLEVKNAVVTVEMRYWPIVQVHLDDGVVDPMYKKRVEQMMAYFISDAIKNVPLPAGPEGVMDAWMLLGWWWQEAGWRDVSKPLRHQLVITARAVFKHVFGDELTAGIEKVNPFKLGEET